jgi:DNA-binding MarR family transcriptional regulator
MLIMEASITAVSNSPSHLLHRAGQFAEDLFTRAVGDLGVTARQYVVLLAVDELDHPSQTILCEVTGIDRSTMADIVRRLVSRGFLTRRRTRDDARMYAVRLTSEGDRILKEVRPIAQKVDGAVVK